MCLVTLILTDFERFDLMLRVLFRAARVLLRRDSHDLFQRLNDLRIVHRARAR